MRTRHADVAWHFSFCCRRLDTLRHCTFLGALIATARAKKKHNDPHMRTRRTQPPSTATASHTSRALDPPTPRQMIDDSQNDLEHLGSKSSRSQQETFRLSGQQKMRKLTGANHTNRRTPPQTSVRYVALFTSIVHWRGILSVTDVILNVQLHGELSLQSLRR